MYGKKLSHDLTKSQLFDEFLDLINNKFESDLSDLQKYQADPVGFGVDMLNETYTDEIKQMMESVRDNPITIAKSANAVGKTHGAARVALWWYKCFPDSQVYTAAAPPESNLRRLLWGEITDIVEKHPDLFKSDTVTSLNVQRSAKSFLTGVTIPSSGSETQREAKFSGKHNQNLLFIVDEGDAVPDEVYRGIESCMSGGHARLLVMFNPRHESGAVYRMERDGKAHVVNLTAFNHPNVVTGKTEIPGAVTREATVRRLNQWCRPVPEDTPPSRESFKLPPYLEYTIASSQSGMEYPPLKPGFFQVVEPAFAYMVLGEYPAQGSNQLISREWLAAARSRWDSYVAENGNKPPAYTPGIMGLDVAEFGADANIACIRYGGFVEDLIPWSGMDIPTTGDRAVSEYKSRNIQRINVDATGVGAGVAPHMQREGCPAESVKVASKPTERTETGEFNILRDQLWWSCREWLRTDTGAMLPPDELLIEELSTPTYEVENGKVRVMKKKVMRELLRRSPDRADALCMTFAPAELLFTKLRGVY